MTHRLIRGGIWKRSVHSPWSNVNGNWRTDISRNVLANPRVLMCEFILDTGNTCRVSIQEIRRALCGKPPRHIGMIVFSMNPIRKTINKCGVEMEIL